MNSDTLPSQDTPSFAIKSYEYKKGIPTYKASILDLTLVSIASLNNIDVSTKFGAEFYKLSGSKINEFLELICKMYETCSVSDPYSLDYRTSYNFWFLETPLKRRVKYAELHLDNAVHKLNLLLNVLIIQLRAKLDFLKNVHLSGEFSRNLIDELEKLLTFLPEPLQKEIVITDRKENVDENGTLPIKTLLITYEPFIEYVNASFNEASKLKRMSNLENKNSENKNVNTIEKQDKKTEFKNQKKAEKPKPKREPKREPKTEVDSEGWVLRKNNKNRN